MKPSSSTFGTSRPGALSRVDSPTFCCCWCSSSSTSCFSLYFLPETQFLSSCQPILLPRHEHPRFPLFPPSTCVLPVRHLHGQPPPPPAMVTVSERQFQRHPKGLPNPSQKSSWPFLSPRQPFSRQPPGMLVPTRPSHTITSFSPTLRLRSLAGWPPGSVLTGGCHPHEAKHELRKARED